MTTSYPGAVDSFSVPSAGDTLASPSHSELHADVGAAVEAIETHLGTVPTVPVTVAIHGKLDGRGVQLLASSDSQTVMTLTAGQQFQDSDYQLIRDVRIEANGHTGITGIETTGDDSTSLAHSILERVTVINTDAIGIDLGNAQFFRSHDLRIISAGIGMLIANDATSGGANSHDHYGLHIGECTVGLVVNGTRFSTPSWSSNFYNPQLIGNSVCGAAFFRANCTFYGGAPEYNATGGATASVDGQTAKRSSMYLSDSMVKVVGLNVGEATANPCFLLEAGSVLTLVDVTGYGLANGILVKADATSGVVLEGILGAMGVVQNVLSWPDAWVLPATAQSILYGAAVHSIDPSVPVLYSHIAPPFPGGGSNAPSMSYVEDADLGYCRQAVYTANVGSVNANFAYIDGITLAASQDTVFSVLVKSSIDIQVGFNLQIVSTYNYITTEEIYLKAGVVTRLVFGMRDLPAGALTLFIYPHTTAAPTIQFSAFQIYQGATGTPGTTQTISRIAKLGAFNPGPLRDTTTNLALQSAAVNIKGKYPGKQVWNSTTNRVVYAAGGAVGDVWKDGVNATVHTPV